MISLLVRRPGAVIAAGCAAQLIFVLGWIMLGKQNAPQWEKWGLVGFFLAASFAALFKIAAQGLWRDLLLCCGGLAAGSVVIYQALGFTLFPGLVKDIGLFSLQHLGKALSVLFVSCVAYLMLALVIRLVAHLGRERPAR